MNAVAQVNIPDSAGAIQHIGAAGATGAGVAREIVLTIVRLRLHDHARGLAPVGKTADEILPQEPAGERNRFLLLE
jgi:hypothetical protein